MADYRVVARQKAQRYGVDPRVFERQIQAESGFNPHAQSGAGAKGIAQFIDSTAKQYGVNVNDPISSLDGAARLMRDALKKSGGDYKKALSIYNSGRPDGYLKFAETKNYVAKILGGVTPQTTAPRAEPARSAASGTPAGLTRPQILQQYLAQRGRPGALLGLAQGLGDLQTPAAPTAAAVPAPMDGHMAGGAKDALDWAVSKVGFKETGTNSGGLASYANKRFGLDQAPWCAMFTSLAVTKGGAPPEARSASVAELVHKAQTGQGYHKGFVDPRHAQAGDLIAFGTSHIGMVDSVNRDGSITMVAGNDSDGVQRRTVHVGAGDKIIRPKYR